MPRWDLQCEQCGRIYTDQEFKTARDRNGWLKHIVCDEPCYGHLGVVPSMGSFKVEGFNAKNGYSK